MKNCKKPLAVLFATACMLILSACGATTDERHVTQDSPGYAQEYYSEYLTTDEQQQESHVMPVSAIDLGNYNNLPAWLVSGVEAYQSGSQTLADAAEWYANAISRGLPGLTDEWFIPGFIDDSLGEYAEAVAYSFVRHLFEIDELDGLISLYRQIFEEIDLSEISEAAYAGTAPLVREAEYARASLWAGFVGAAVANTSEIIFQYHAGQVLGFTSGFYPVPVGFSVLADYCWYFFTPSGWSREHVHNYIEAGEESTRFVGDILGYHHYAPIMSLIRGDNPNNPGGGYVHKWIDQDVLLVVYNHPEMPPLAFTHEMAHVIIELHPDIENGGLPLAPRNFAVNATDDDGNFFTLDFNELRIDGRSLNEFTLNDDLDEIFAALAEDFGYHIGASIFSLFEEGLCVFIEYMFLIYVQNQWYAQSMAGTIFSQAVLNQETGMIYPPEILQRSMDEYFAMGGFDYAEEYIQFREREMDSAIEAFAVQHERRASREEIIASVHARALLQDMASNDFDNTAQFGERYGILNAYYTAGSFIFYLLEHRGTMEDFLQIYSDFSQMEAVYGVTMAEMIDDWLLYLDTRFSPEILELFQWRNQFATRYAGFTLEWQIQMLRETAEIMGWDDEHLEGVIESVTAQTIG